jgi:hypothetical protein
VNFEDARGLVQRIGTMDLNPSPVLQAAIHLLTLGAIGPRLDGETEAEYLRHRRCSNVQPAL